MLQSERVRGEPGVIRQSLQACRRTKSSELLIVADDQHDVPIPARKTVAGIERRQPVAGWYRHLACGQVIGGDVRQARDLYIQQGDVNVLSTIRQMP